jgi:endonuclease/exonuclease/phosphatase family metal-dependent hydrolase
MDLLAEQLHLLKPDIIACQECFYCEKNNTDTLKFLADELKMNAAFTEGRSKKRYFEGEWIDSQSGLGLLSVFPIEVINEYRLPSVPEDNDRKVQQTDISLPSGLKLLINNTHLTHLRNKKLKQLQAEALVKAVNNKNYHYNIVCGDFNSTINSDELTFFKSHANFIDCYAAGDGTEPRYSLAEPYPQNKWICVDHIFSAPLKGNSSYPEFKNSGIVLNEPDEKGLYPSDHFGITTTLITD